MNRDMGPSNPTPLVTIRFVDDSGDELAVLFWYHVPRVGEFVDLGETFGIVRSVRWSTQGAEILLA